MKFICPLLTVTDITQSRQFYEKILGQKVRYDFGESITFHGDFAIHLRSHYKNLIDNREVTSGENNFELYFESDEIESISANLKKAGIRFVHELREQPWRQKVVRFYDPDNNIIEIGETLEHLSFRLNQEGLSDNQISEVINMPPDFVNKSIKSFNNLNNRKIDRCTMNDFNEIISDISDFWGSDRTLHLHQSYLIHEFGDTSFVIRENGRVIAYLFGFFSQFQSTAYVHLIGVREQYQKQGLGKLLYDNFIEIARSHNMHKIKAITKPINSKSINFHKNKIGMRLLGEPNEAGINVVKDYSGKNEDRVVFEREI
jgi:catechol 2,3-dioxygenase-like lactoylglutathione lyase family enzyme/GNAT superfamily N-acetyltransferase